VSPGLRSVAFRIVKRQFAGRAFSGVGARLFGGRWNSNGTPVVYAAGSLSLALLEWRVHLGQWPPPEVVVIPIEFDHRLVWVPARLPAGWKQYPAPRATAAFGDAWVKSRRSVVMRLPSVIVPSEWNYVINPNHPDFSKLVIGRPQRLKPDPRLGPIQP
jgi:RES domain-containing protein